MEHELIDIEVDRRPRMLAARIVLVLGLGCLCAAVIIDRHRPSAAVIELPAAAPLPTVPPATTVVPTTVSPTTVVPTTVPPTTVPVREVIPTLDGAARHVHDVARVTLSPLDAMSPTKLADDVPYGDLAQQRLDVYRSTAPGSHHGAIVYLHGGAWVGGSEELSALPFPQIIQHLADADQWTVFSVRYRLAQEAPFPAALLDVNRAVRWVKAHAADYGIDAGQVVVFGYSAGGQLSALLDTTWNVPGLQPTDLPPELAAVSPRPAGAVTLAGPLDPKAWGDSNPDPANTFSPGHAIAAFAGCPGVAYSSCSTEALHAIDVSTYVDDADPAIYIAQGDQDGIVMPLPQQPAVLRLIAGLGEDRVWYDLTTVGAAEDRNHILDMSVNMAALERFLGIVVRA
jgi:acetyl esterase/lipase